MINGSGWQVKEESLKALHVSAQCMQRSSARRGEQNNDWEGQSAFMIGHVSRSITLSIVSLRSGGRGE